MEVTVSDLKWKSMGPICERTFSLDITTT